MYRERDVLAALLARRGEVLLGVGERLDYQFIVVCLV